MLDVATTGKEARPRKMRDQNLRTTIIIIIIIDSSQPDLSTDPTGISRPNVTARILAQNRRFSRDL